MKKRMLRSRVCKILQSCTQGRYIILYNGCKRTSQTSVKNGHLSKNRSEWSPCFKQNKLSDQTKSIKTIVWSILWMCKIHRTGVSLVLSLSVKSSCCTYCSWVGNTQGPCVRQCPVRSIKQWSRVVFANSSPSLSIPLSGMFQFLSTFCFHCRN